MLTHRIEQQLAPAASTPDIGECRNAEHHVLDAQQQFEERCAPEAKVGERTDELLLERDNLNETGIVVHLSERSEGTRGDEPVILGIAGLDITGALSRLNGDKKFFFRMLRTFFGYQSNAVTDIEDALSAGDTKLALHHVNSAKCIAGTMGAVELERLALVVKNAVVFDEPTVLVRIALDRFGAELDRLVTGLESHLKDIPLTGNDLLSEMHAHITVRQI